MKNLRIVKGSEITHIVPVQVVKSIRLVFSLIWLRLIVMAMTKFSENSRDHVVIKGLPAQLITLSTTSEGELKTVEDKSNRGIEYSYQDIQNIVGWIAFAVDHYNHPDAVLSPEGEKRLVELKLISISLREVLLPQPVEQ